MVHAVAVLLVVLSCCGWFCETHDDGGSIGISCSVMAMTVWPVAVVLVLLVPVVVIGLVAVVAMVGGVMVVVALVMALAQCWCLYQSWHFYNEVPVH